MPNPNLIRNPKKTPISGGAAYIDGGDRGSRTVTQTPSRTPSRSNASSDRGTGVNIYEKNGVMTKAAGKVPALSRDVLGGSGGYQIGRLQGNRSAGSSASGTGVSGSTTESAVQEEIKRRVSNAAQNGTYGADNGSGVSASTPSVSDGGSYGGSDYNAGGSGAMSYEDYYKQVGGDVYESDLQKAIAARVKQAADSYNRQKEQAGTAYEDAARQAYISSMMSQRNLDQQLAVNGIYGGMADSQRIALDASYQNEVSDLERQYIETLADLDQAITDARLAGDAQAAEQMASYKSSVQSQYANYLLQKDQEAASAAQWQREYEAQLELQRRQAAAQAAADSASYGGGSSYTGYGNGGLSASQVAEMQQALGVTADGVWGPQSSAAAGGMTAAEAWQAYQEATQGSSQGGYSYGGANVNRMSRM